MPEWINVRTCGARGDGFTDDTEAFRKAIETGRVVYVPTGRYLVTDTIRLRSEHRPDRSALPRNVCL
jgi:polygalacturonase